jgi:hypothetical protein
MIKDEDGLRDYLVNYSYVTAKLRIPLVENAIRLLNLSYESDNENDRPITFTDVARVLIHALVCVELDEEELDGMVDKYIMDNMDPEELREFIDFKDDIYTDTEDEDEDEDEDEE